PSYPFEKQRHWISSVASRPENIPRRALPPDDSDATAMWHAAVKEGDARSADLTFDLGQFSGYNDDLAMLCSYYILDTLKSLEMFNPGDEIQSVASLMARAGIVPKYRQLMSRLLNALAMSGNLDKQEEDFCNPLQIDSDDIAELIEKMKNSYPGSGEWMNVISLCGEHLDSVLTGRTDPLEVLFPKGSMEMVERAYQNNEVSEYFNGIMVGIVDTIRQMLPKHTCLRILEIGAGTGATTREILPALQSENVKYVFTDISPVFLNHAETKFNSYPFVEYKTLDIELSPEDQGIDTHGYDLVIAANVLHATRDLNIVMKNVASLLAPNGMLILREITTPQIMFDLIFGPVLNILTDESLRGGQPFLSPEKWKDLLGSSGFVKTRAFSDTDKKLGEHILISQLSSSSLPGVSSAFIRPAVTGRPLVGERLLSPFPVFEFKLDLESFDTIKHHRILDDIVLPGAVFFEMAANAGEQVFSKEIRLRDVTLHRTLVMPEDDTQKHLQVVMESDGSDEERSFKIFSLTRTENDSSWELHASGIIQPFQTGDGNDLPGMAPFTDIQEKFCKTDNLVQVVSDSEDIFKIERIWRDQQEAFVSVQISPAELGNSRRYKIHPLILNPVMQSMVKAFTKKADDFEKEEMMYIPVKVKQIICHGGLTDRLWCLLSVHGDDVATSEGFSFDCRILDQSGTCVAEFTGIYVHRIDPISLQWKKSGQENLFYRIDWQGQTLQPAAPYSPGKWVIFADQKGVGRHMADLLESRGEFCIQIYPDTGDVRPEKNIYVIDPENPDDYDRIFQKLSRDMPEFGMIHLWSMDATPNDYAKCGSLLHIAKAIVTARNVSTKLSIITQGAYKINGAPVSVAQAPTSGLAKVLAKEHPELNCLSIDVDALDTDAELLQALDEIQHGGSEGETAFRDGARYVPRLTRCLPGIRKEPPCLNNRGTYMITGAFGGLGMALAHWLVRNGGQNLLLVGRNKPDDDTLKKIKEMEALGGRVYTLIADVSDLEALSSGFNAIREDMPPLKGVFHLAGVLKGGMILQQSYEDYAETMAPKASGAWHLHQLTQDLSLDFFVLFSTSSTLWGIQGVGAYTAANTFLDSLAQYRVLQGLPALSINWGTWARIGAAAELNLEARLSGQGFNSISPETCFDCLGTLLQCDMDQVGVMAMDWKKFLNRFPPNDKPPLFSSLEQVHSPGGMPENKAVSSDEKAIPSSDVLQQLPSHDQQALMKTYLQKEISRILRIRENKISDDQNLIELGMDSLIFIELSQTLGEDLQLKIVPHKIFENPTIAAMARQFIGDMVIDKTVSVLDSELTQDITITHDIDNRYAPFDLTDIQQAYWIGRVNTLELGNIACHVYMEIDAAHLDYGRYNRAWQTLIRRHEMLRTVILPQGAQKILKTVLDYQIETTDLTGKSREQTETALADMRDAMSHQVLDPEVWPIFDIKISRIDNETSRIHLSLDMLVVDALSVSQLMRELVLLYRDENAPLSSLDLSFRDYVLAEKQFEGSALFQQSKAYWINRLTQIPPGPELPLIKNPGDVATPRFKRRTFRLEPDIWKQLKKKAANAGLTPSGLLLSCYAEILATWSKTARFTINMTIFNRLPVHPQVNDIIGDFTSLIMLVVDTGGQKSFMERAQKIQEQFWRDVEHRHFSGVRVLRELSRMQSGNVSMPVVFTSNIVYGDLDEIRSEFPVMGDVVYTVTQTPQVWLDHQITEQGNTLVLDWDAVEELFPEGMLDDMFNAYHSLLKHLAVSDDWHVNMDLMPEDQIRRRRKVNATEKPVSRETLNSLFVKQAEQQPDQTAVITSSGRISYKDLYHQSMVVASLLADHGARSNALVAVVMEKGWEQVVAVLGVLNSGAAYLPIDPAVPRERLWHLLEDGEVKSVLTQSWVDQNLEWPKDVDVFSVDRLDYACPTSVQIEQGPDDLAYVIHTSGSTGLPKGVMID
ncbi:MAG: SDR family NAD(P)-dependent oxidoreductase, partial [Desulfobacterales bacterium]|nr:SDR family NAD(P)-dependent oxidoreductase [Desulfobacterales bacterium]